MVEYLAPEIDRGKIDLLIFHPLPTAVLLRPEKARASTRTSVCPCQHLSGVRSRERYYERSFDVSPIHDKRRRHRGKCLPCWRAWKKHFHTTKEYISIASSIIAVKFMSEKIKYSYERKMKLPVFILKFCRKREYFLFSIVNIRMKPPVLETEFWNFALKREFFFIWYSNEKNETTCI